ncbi:MAG TPA: signal peptidase I [Patescibacteria group bacterium]|nr:signal peptidase I [Patescibacteria group bacterium]
MPGLQQIKDWLLTLALAAILALTIRAYVAEARWIPSESMVPTLQIGDYLLIEKLSGKAMGYSRGDIVVFSPPSQSGLHEEMIKRVIGLPGDTIFIQDSTVYVNNVPLTEPYVPEKIRQNFAAFQVPAHYLFVMGDNRNNSFDSRFWGPVSEDAVIGKALFRYYPFQHFTLFSASKITR